MSEERRGKKTQLHKLLVAGHDIGEAAEMFSRFRQPGGGMSYPLGVPLFQAGVVAYARPFTRNLPLGPLAARWSKFDDPSFQTIHDFLMNARNRYVAHGDVREVQIVPLGAPTSDGTPARQLMYVITTTWETTEPFDRAIELCSDLRRRLNTEGHRLLSELYEKRSDLPKVAFRLDPDDDL